MGFWEDIYRLRQAGLIPRVWTRSHIQESLSEKYDKDAIKASPNYASLTREGAVIAGECMKKGMEPKAWRLGIGAFSLIEDPGDDEKNRAAERNLARARCEKIDEFSEPGDFSKSDGALNSNSDYWADLRGKPYIYIRPLDGVFE